MGYRLVIFDLDGTILDTLEDLTDAVNYALEQSGQPVRSIGEVREFVGNGVKKLIERAVQPETGPDETDKIFDAFMSYYKVHCADKTKAYDGINELLSELKKEGFLTAVVSNKADVAVKKLCEQYFSGFFDYCVGERAGILKKPAPDSVNEVLKKLSVNSAEAVYVGDSDVDLDTARNAGLDCISVNWGFRSEKFLLEHGAVKVAKSAKQIMDYVREA